MLNKKNIISFLLSFVIIASLFLQIASLSCNAVTPRWTSINMMDLDMVFVNGMGDVCGTASKQTHATSIEGILTLFELIDGEWEEVDQWFNRKTVGTLAVYGDFICRSGQSYKAKFEVTVYAGTEVEEETIEIIKTCP